MNGLVRWGGGKRHSPSISCIRLVAMLLIISCHICQYYGNELAWWLNVGVQIFFVLSGFLYGNKRIDEPIEWIRKQFVKILPTYYLFIFITVILYLIFSPETLSIKEIAGSIFCVGTLKGIGHLWFVGNILICYLLTPYLDWIFRRNAERKFLSNLKKLIFLAVVFTFTGIYLQSYFRPGHILCYIVGYVLSVTYRDYGDKVIYNTMILSGVVAFVLKSVYAYLKYFKNVEMIGIWSHFHDYSHMVGGVFIMTLLLVLLYKVPQLKIASFSDKYSYEIYIVHQLFILSPLTLMALTNYPVVNIVVTLLSIGISGVVLKIMTRSLLKTIKIA